MAMQGWTDIEVSKLRTLWAEGITTAEIGRRLFRLKNSVISKAHRLGLDGRTSPIISRGEPRMARVKPTLPVMPSEAPVPVQAVPSASVAARASHTPSIFDNVVYRPVVREAPRLPIPTTKTCQYPVAPGTEVGTPWLFCGRPAVIRSYCLDCAKICFVGVRRIAA